MICYDQFAAVALEDPGILHAAGKSYQANPESHRMNHLIATLPAKEHQQILGWSETVELESGTLLCGADEPFRHAYFPLTSVISLVAVSRGRRPLGLAMIGNEGMLGATLALGINTSRLRAVVHGSGAALRVPVKPLRDMLRTAPGLLRAVHRYSFVLMGQLVQTAVCNSFHEVETRLARSLLMTDDRGLIDQIKLTHQALADLLGVQRSAVTIAAGKLQRKKLIAYSRGYVHILSRSGLENASCECYGMQVSDHARHFTRSHKPAAP
jgi:CRP-like cAMP-binding protein